MTVHHQRSIVVTTAGQGLTDITAQVGRVVEAAQVELGLVTVFVKHTSASLIINENADPDVRRDLLGFFARLVPEYDQLYTHTAEGPDDMPAHVKSALTATSLSIPVSDGRMCLGTWQGIYLWEHRRSDHHRHVVIHVTGTSDRYSLTQSQANSPTGEM